MNVNIKTFLGTQKNLLSDKFLLPVCSFMPF